MCNFHQIHIGINKNHKVMPQKAIMGIGSILWTERRFSILVAARKEACF